MIVPGYSLGQLVPLCSRIIADDKANRAGRVIANLKSMMVMYMSDLGLSDCVCNNKVPLWLALELVMLAETCASLHSHLLKHTSHESPSLVSTKLET